MVSCNQRGLDESMVVGKVSQSGISAMSTVNIEHELRREENENDNINIDGTTNDLTVHERVYRPCVLLGYLRCVEGNAGVSGTSWGRKGVPKG